MLNYIAINDTIWFSMGKLKNALQFECLHSCERKWIEFTFICNSKINGKKTRREYQNGINEFSHCVVCYIKKKEKQKNRKLWGERVGGRVRNTRTGCDCARMGKLKLDRENEIEIWEESVHLLSISTFKRLYLTT